MQQRGDSRRFPGQHRVGKRPAPKRIERANRGVDMGRDRLLERRPARARPAPPAFAPRSRIARAHRGRECPAPSRKNRRAARATDPRRGDRPPPPGTGNCPAPPRGPLRRATTCPTASEGASVSSRRSSTGRTANCEPAVLTRSPPSRKGSALPAGSSADGNPRSSPASRACENTTSGAALASCAVSARACASSLAGEERGTPRSRCHASGSIGLGSGARGQDSASSPATHNASNGVPAASSSPRIWIGADGASG